MQKKLTKVTTRCMKCQSETRKENYCMTCLTDIKSKFEEKYKMIISEDKDEQITTLLIEVVKNGKLEHLEKLVQQIKNKNKQAKEDIRKKILRAVLTKDIDYIIKDMNLDVSINRRVKYDICAICGKKQDFNKEPIIGCIPCNEDLKLEIKQEKMLLLKKEETEYKRLFYLESEYYRGALTTRTKELSYIWFGEIKTKEDVQKRIKELENEKKVSLQQLKKNVAEQKEIFKEESKNNLLKEKCIICEKELEPSEKETKYGKCEACDKEIEKDVEMHDVQRGTEEFRSVKLHCYIKKIFDNNKMTPEFYSYLKKNQKENNFYFDSLEDMKNKVNQYMDSLKGINDLVRRENQHIEPKNVENVLNQDMIIPDLSSELDLPFLGKELKKKKEEKLKENKTIKPKAIKTKKKEEKYVALKNVKEYIQNELNIQQLKKLREEKGMKNIEESRVRIIAGEKGSGKTTAIRMMIEKLSEGKAVYEIKHSADFSIIEEKSVMFIQMNKGLEKQELKKVIELVNQKKEIYIEFGSTEEAKDFNQTIDYACEEIIYTKAYTNKELVEIFDCLVEEHQYEFSNYARTELKNYLKEVKSDAHRIKNIFRKTTREQLKRNARKEKVNLTLLTKEDLLNALK